MKKFIVVLEDIFYRMLYWTEPLEMIEKTKKIVNFGRDWGGKGM